MFFRIDIIFQILENEKILIEILIDILEKKVILDE